MRKLKQKPNHATHLRLEAREEIDEERMPRRIGHFKDSLLGEQRFNFVTGDYVALLQRFDGKVLVRVSVLRQNDLRTQLKKS